MRPLADQGMLHASVLRSVDSYLAWVFVAPDVRGRWIREGIKSWRANFSPPLELEDCVGFWTDALVAMLLRAVIPTGKLLNADLVLCANRACQLVVQSAADLCWSCGWIPNPVLRLPPHVQYATFRSRFDCWNGLRLHPALSQVLGSTYPPEPDSREAHLYADWVIRKQDFHPQKDWDAILGAISKGQAESKGGQVERHPVEMHQALLLQALDFTEHRGAEALHRRADGSIVLGWTQYRDDYHRELGLARTRRRVKRDADGEEGGLSRDGTHEHDGGSGASDGSGQVRAIQEAVDVRSLMEATRSAMEQGRLVRELVEDALAEAGPGGLSLLGPRFPRLVELLVSSREPGFKAALLYEYGRWLDTGRKWTRKQVAEDCGVSVRTLGRFKDLAAEALFGSSGG